MGLMLPSCPNGKNSSVRNNFSLAICLSHWPIDKEGEVEGAEIEGVERV